MQSSVGNTLAILTTITFVDRYKSNYGANAEDTEKFPIPEEDEIFKTGSSFVNFIHLYIVIGMLLER